jgi:N-acetylglucosaminyldiphosphoundecaprenol N-acetyl-beta-D-mannosaminyltransferase
MPAKQALRATPPLAGASPGPRRRLNILGVNVDDSPLAATVARCAQMLREPPGGAGGRLHQVVTVNPEFVMQARRDRQFRAVLNRADLATPDGVGIVAAARLLGRPLGGRTTGVALAEQLAALAAREGYRVFLLGAQPGVAAEAGRIWAGRYPGLQIAGAYPGSPAPAERDEIVARITAAEADILMVAFGAPAQDCWIARNAAALPTVRLALGVGGVFDYLTGRVPLAPAPIRRIGLEWLYRLYRQPWRWRRMLALPRFAAAVLGQRLGLVRPPTTRGTP